MDRVNRFSKITLKVVALLSVFLMIFAAPSVARAETAKEIDVGMDVALANFAKEVKGAKEFLQASKGVLVFPKVYKAGFFWLGASMAKGRCGSMGRPLIIITLLPARWDSNSVPRSRR